jgi:hypothetical protein
MTQQTVLIEEDASEHAIKRRSKLAIPPPSVAAQGWLALERERRALEAKLKSVVAEQENVRLRLLDEWSTNGINKEVVDGYTIHTQRKLYPKVADKARLTIELLKAGMPELLTVDEKAFAIYVTTCEENGTPLPDSIAAYVFEKFERFAIVVRIPGHGH